MNLKSLKDGVPQHGIMFRLLQSNASLDIAKHAGFDLVFFDFEHGAFTYEAFSSTCSHARLLGLSPFVRVPELARSHVSRALDCGAAGVMVPMLETGEQAAQLVQWAKYPPLGRRGLSSAGGHTDYIKIAHVVNFMAEANRQTLAIAQIETGQAIEEIDSIASTPGLDVLLIGPNDLAVSLGCPGELDNPMVSAAITRVAEASRKYGKIFGMHAGTPFLRKWVSHGLTFVVNSLDMEALAQGFAQISAASRSLIEEGK